MFYFWLIIAIILSILEILTTNLVSIWFIISSILTMFLSLVTTSILTQFTVFVIVGIILLISTKDIVKKIIPTKTKTNIDRIIDMTGIVTQKITPKKSGEVKVDGKIWTAISKETIEENIEVEILEIDSTKLIVKRKEK